MHKGPDCLLDSALSGGPLVKVRCPPVETPSGTGREEPGGKAETVEPCRCLDRMYEAARGKL